MGEASYAFIFGNFFAIVGQHAGASLNRGASKEAEPMYAQGVHTHPCQAVALGPMRGSCCWCTPVAHQVVLRAERRRANLPRKER